MRAIPLKGFISLGLAAFALLLAMSPPAHPQTAAAPAAPAAPAAAEETSEDEAAPLTLDELKILTARIALYPDDLVALCISASLYPLQIVQAARFLEEKKKSPDLEPSEKWDGSVVSLLNYPSVVQMMNDDLEWTEQLGDATANQQKDVLVAIQQLRDEAVEKDILKSSSEVQIVNEGDNVVIKSADPQTTYVPTYPPEMLYEPGYVTSGNPISYDPYPSYYYPTAPYWAGLVTGAAFAAIVDWDDWGTWGGDLDIDVDAGDNINFDFDKIDMDNIDVDKLKNLDFKNLDRSKINLQNANIDRNKLKQNLKSKDANNIARKARDRGQTSQLKQARAHDLKGKDVRKNVAEGLKDRPSAKLSKPGTKRPDATRVNNNLKKSKPAGNKSSAQRVSQKKVAKNKAGARPDNRSRTPSAIGQSKTWPGCNEPFQSWRSQSGRRAALGRAQRRGWARRRRRRWTQGWRRRPPVGQCTVSKPAQRDAFSGARP